MKIMTVFLLALMLSACAGKVLVSRSSCEVKGSFDGDELLECKEAKVSK